MAGSLADTKLVGDMLLEVPITENADGLLRAKVRALYMLLERFSIRWAQGMYTIVDRSPDDPYITELMIHLEALRGKNIQRVEVFQGKTPLRFNYQMGFNNSESTAPEITQFMRAYTYHWFPIWETIDTYVMLEMQLKYNLPPFRVGINEYERLFLRGYSINAAGDFQWSELPPVDQDDPKAAKERESYLAEEDTWLRSSPGACDMVKVYHFISERVRRFDVCRRLRNSVIRSGGEMPEGVVAEECPSLLAMCTAVINKVTVDQDQKLNKDRAANYPHWIKPTTPFVSDACARTAHVADGHIPFLRPDFYHHAGAFKTGGNPKGILDNLMKANRETVTTAAKPSHLLAGIMSIFRTFDLYNSVEPFISYDEFMETLRNMSVPWDRNAGIHFNERGDLGSYEYQFDNLDPNIKVKVTEERKFGFDADRKENAFPAVVEMIEDLLHRLDRHTKLETFYSRKWFPLITAKLGNKVEILFPEADRSKNRIFFISCLMKMVLQKMLLSATLANTYGRNFVGISHCWSKGGVHRVASQLKFSDALGAIRSWFMGDFSALDQSLKAGVLCLLGIMWIFSIRPGASHDRVGVAMKHMMAWLADDTAITLVKWFQQEWRLVFGILFSGEYITSIFDTFYVYIAMMVVHYVFADRLQAIGTPRALKARELLMFELEKFALIYGDDLCWTLSDELVRELEELCCNKKPYLDEVVIILKQQFDMVLKPPGSSDTNRYHTPFSNVTKDGVVLPTYDNDYGFKWLRRHFYQKPNKNLASIRRISDYWSKATNTHHDALYYTNDKWLQRIKAFTVENMGNSKMIDLFCRQFYHALEKHPVKCVDPIEIERAIPVKGKIHTPDFRPVHDGVGEKVVEDKKYLFVDPNLSQEFKMDKRIPSRRDLINRFSSYKNDAAFTAGLRSCEKMKEGPILIVPDA